MKNKVSFPSVSLRVVLALIATPFALCIVGLLTLPLAAMWTSKPELAGFSASLIFSPVFAVPITLFVFIPACLVLRLMGKVGLWKCVSAGIFSALIFANGVGTLPNPFVTVVESASFLYALLNSGYPLFIFCGAFSGATFWFFGLAGTSRTQIPNDLSTNSNHTEGFGE